MNANLSHQLGKYRLVGMMAAGGMARLFLALMTGVDKFSRVVLLKQVLPHLAQSQDLIKMFINEARLAARLDHPNIVRTYELSAIDDQYFLSMEYLPGEDLTRVLKRTKQMGGQVPIETVIGIVQGASDALHAAHELVDDKGKPIGLVHRDVSLSNIILTYHGLSKLADFGIAKETANADKTSTNFKGKFAYASPEQIAGTRIDRRTDIFALGIVFWELLTIQRLFKRQNDAATIRAVETADVPNIMSLRPDIHPELAQIVMKALAKDPQDRFQTAGEMSDALEAFIEHENLRPSARQMSVWMKDLFGEEVANLKKEVAQGRGLSSEHGLTLSESEAALIGLKPLPSQWRTPSGRLDLPSNPKEEAQKSSRSESVSQYIEPPQGLSSNTPAHSTSSQGQFPLRSDSSFKPKPTPSGIPKPAWSQSSSTSFGANTTSNTRSLSMFGGENSTGSHSSISRPENTSTGKGGPPAKIKWALLGSIVMIILFSSILFFANTKPAESTARKVTFKNIPVGIELMVENQNIQNEETVNLKPGKYTGILKRGTTELDRFDFNVTTETELQVIEPP